MVQTLEAQGAKDAQRVTREGTMWSDSSDHDDVTKIYVRGGLEGIQQIRFDYVKNGQLKDGPVHGKWDRGFTQTFEINHLKDEHLQSVDGYYNAKTAIIQALQFKTNMKISEIMGYDEDLCDKFTLTVTGKKIIGFHGSTIINLRSLGAYFTWINPTKTKAKGGKGGQHWDDGYDHEGVTKIHVRGGVNGLQFIKFDNLTSGQTKYGSIHGASGKGLTQLFEINHLDKEYLVSFDGYYDDVSGVIQGLQFKTNKKTSELMGYDKGRKFCLAVQGKKIVGFHGYAENNLNSLGAYFTTQPLIKMEYQGGTGGDLWDDGVFDGIRKVYVHYDPTIIRCIRFDYDNGGKVEKREHNYLKLGQKEGEFAVDYPYEFITSIKGTFSSRSTTYMITSLIFKTSKGRTSPKFGNTPDSKYLHEFVLESKGYALVGFHGRSTGALIALGAYFYPLPPVRDDAKKLEASGGDGGTSWDDGAFDGVRKIYIGLSENAVAFVKFIYDQDTQMVVGDDHGNKTILGVEEFVLDYPSEYIILVEGRYGVVSGSKKFEVILMLRFTTNKRISQSFGFTDKSSFVLENDGHKIVGFHGKSSHLLHQIGVHVLPI